MHLWLLRGCVYVHDQGKNLDLNACMNHQTVTYTDSAFIDF